MRSERDWTGHWLVVGEKRMSRIGVRKPFPYMLCTAVYLLWHGRSWVLLKVENYSRTLYTALTFWYVSRSSYEFFFFKDFFYSFFTHLIFIHFLYITLKQRVRSYCVISDYDSVVLNNTIYNLYHAHSLCALLYIKLINIRCYVTLFTVNEIISKYLIILSTKTKY